MDIQKQKDSLKEIIDALSYCENENKNCRRCKLRKEGCILFVRNAVAVALQYILSTMETTNTPESLYS